MNYLGELPWKYPLGKLGLIRMLIKGLRQVADVHCNARLCPFFTVMCNTTA